MKIRQLPAVLNKNYVNNTDDDDHTLFLEPLSDVYFSNRGASNKTGNLTNIKIFSVIAASILLIACINFMNLATAWAKEVGVEEAAMLFESASSVIIVPSYGMAVAQAQHERGLRWDGKRTVNATFKVKRSYDIIKGCYLIKSIRSRTFYLFM